MTTVTFTAVDKAFGDTQVLQSLDLDVREGEFLVVVGPSGCGKSTVLRLLAGLEEPTSGDIAFDGNSVLATSPKDRDVAMVFQNYALYPHMSVFDNMAFALKMRGEDKTAIKNKVTDAATLLGLENLLNRKPKQLSGGQRQRVSLGRAIVRQPNVFLMDEPLSNLDAKLRVSMRQEIRALHQRLGITTLYVTHDQAEAMTMGDRIAVLNGGVLEQCGTPQAIYDTPANPFVAQFMAPVNWLPVVEHTAGEPTALVAGQPVAVPEKFHQHGALQVGFRPEVAVVAAGEAMGMEALRLNAVVDTAEFLGGETRVYGHLADNPDVPVAWVTQEHTAKPSGYTVTLQVVFDRLMWFAK